MSPQKAKPVPRKGLIQAVAVVFTVLILSVLMKSDSYLLFHSIVEIFSTAILWSIFVLAFNTRRFLKTSYFILLGTGFLFVGIFDIFHTLAYKGMRVLPGSDSGNLPTQLWIAMRYLLGFSYLLAPFFLRKKTGFLPLFIGFFIVATALLLAILWRPVFPVCFDATGLTPFKKTSEYIICIILMVSLWLLNRNRQAFHADVFRLLCWSIVLTAASEISFTFYKDTTGLFNALGHVLEVLAFLAAYKAIIEKGLVHPNDLVFFDMKRHEAALSESEKRYKSLFNSMTEGFALHEIICDDQGKPCDYRFLDVNPAFEQMTGLERKNVIGRTHNEVLPGDDPRWVAEYAAVALTGKSVRFQNYSPALKRHYDVSAYRPAPLQFAVVFMDITELKLAEQMSADLAAKVLEEKERLLALINSTPDEIWFADADGKFTLMNSAASHAFSLKDQPELPVEKLAESLEVFRENGTPRPVEEAPPIRALRGEFVKGETEIIRLPSTGELQHRQVNAAPVYDTEKKIIGSVSVVRDITDLKKTEEMLRQNEARLRAALLAGRAFIFEWIPGTG